MCVWVCACAVCTIWFVWETVSLVLCVRLVGQRWASGEVVFLLRVPLGLYESVRERRIYCYTLVLTHIHTQFCLSASYIHTPLNDFSSSFLFDPRFSLLSVHPNGRKEKWEMKKRRRRQLLSSSSSLLLFFPPSCSLYFVDTPVCPKRDLSCLVEQGKPQGFCGGDRGVPLSTCVCVGVLSFVSFVCRADSAVVSVCLCVQVSGDRAVGWEMDLRHTPPTLKRPTCIHTYINSHTDMQSHRGSLSPFHTNQMRQPLSHRDQNN